MKAASPSGAAFVVCNARASFPRKVCLTGIFSRETRVWRSDFLMRLQLGLVSLGLKRLVTLGIAGIAVFTLVAASSYYLSLPQREVIYSGLDLQDISQIGAVLEESGVPFDVNPEGTAVLVDYGQYGQGTHDSG